MVGQCQLDTSIAGFQSVVKRFDRLLHDFLKEYSQWKWLLYDRWMCRSGVENHKAVTWVLCCLLYITTNCTQFRLLVKMYSFLSVMHRWSSDLESSSCERIKQLKTRELLKINLKVAILFYDHNYVNCLAV